MDESENSCYDCYSQTVNGREKIEHRGGIWVFLCVCFSRLGTERTSSESENRYSLIQGFPSLFSMALSFSILSYLVQLSSFFLLFSWFLLQLRRGHWITDNLDKLVWSLFFLPKKTFLSSDFRETFSVECFKRQSEVCFLYVLSLYQHLQQSLIVKFY